MEVGILPQLPDDCIVHGDITVLVTFGVADVEHADIKIDVGDNQVNCHFEEERLFSDTVDCAKASATIYSLVLTCRACGVEPYDYLPHGFTELPQRAGCRRDRSSAVRLCTATAGQGTG